MALSKAKEPQFAVCSSSRDEQGEYDERTELYRIQDGKWVLVNASKSDGKHLWTDRVRPNGPVYATPSDNTSHGDIGTLHPTTGPLPTHFQDPVAAVPDPRWNRKGGGQR